MNKFYIKVTKSRLPLNRGQVLLIFLFGLDLVRCFVTVPLYHLSEYLKCRCNVDD
jgi:hypothetical protein